VVEEALLKNLVLRSSPRVINITVGIIITNTTTDTIIIIFKATETPQAYSTYFVVINPGNAMQYDNRFIRSLRAYIVFVQYASRY